MCSSQHDPPEKMDEFHTCRHLLDHKFPCFVCLGLNPLKKPFPGRDWDCNGLNIASFESQLTRGSNSIGPNQGCDKPATPRPPHPPCQALATRTREILRKRLVGFMDSYKVMPHSWISCAEKTPICHQYVTFGFAAGIFIEFIELVHAVCQQKSWGTTLQWYQTMGWWGFIPPKHQVGDLPWTLGDPTNIRGRWRIIQAPTNQWLLVSMMSSPEMLANDVATFFSRAHDDA